MTIAEKVDLKTQFTCPNCLASLIVPENEISAATRCPVCQLVFNVPYPVAQIASVNEPGVAAKVYY